MGQLSRQREVQQLNSHIKLGKLHPLEDFFASYSDFNFDPRAPSGLEYRRLYRLQHWKHGDAAQKAAWRAFRLALVKEFNASFGRDARNLLAWQTLCVIVGIEQVNKMTNWEDCEKALKSRYFNLVDVLDARRRDENETVQTFTTAEELEQYMKKTGAYFPRDHEEAGSLLTRILRRPHDSGGANASKVRPLQHGFQRTVPKEARCIYKATWAQRIQEDIKEAEDLEGVL